MLIFLLFNENLNRWIFFHRLQPSQPLWQTKKFKHTQKYSQAKKNQLQKTTQQKVSQNSAEQNNTYNFYTRLNSEPQQQNSDRTTNQSTQQRYEIHSNTQTWHSPHSNR